MMCNHGRLICLDLYYNKNMASMTHSIVGVGVGVGARLPAASIFACFRLLVCFATQRFLL